MSGTNESGDLTIGSSGDREAKSNLTAEYAEEAEKNEPENKEI